MSRAGKGKSSKKPMTFEQYLQLAPLNALVCRALQHSWNEDAGTVTMSGGAYVWEIPCGRGCGTVRSKTISARGKILATGYKYREGYLLHTGGQMDKADRASIRLAVLKEYM
jgi:hypothetical protein